MSQVTLFDDQTADGVSSFFNANQVNPNQIQYPFLSIKGTFDGATVTLQWRDPDGNWDASDASEDVWTEPKLQPLYLNSYSSYRLSISNAGASTSIKAWGFGVAASA